MKKKNITGVATISSFIALVTVLFVITGQGEMVEAIYVKLSMSLAVLLIVSAGFYVIDAFRKDTKPALKKLTWLCGLILFLLALFISFDILPFLTSWNWLIAFIILYIMLIQIQLLHWGKQVPQLVRFSALFVILSDLFLVFFFIAKWKSYEFETLINLAVVFSIVFTSLGLVLIKDKKES